MRYLKKILKYAKRSMSVNKSSIYISRVVEKIIENHAKSIHGKNKILIDNLFNGKLSKLPDIAKDQLKYYIKHILSGNLTQNAHCEIQRFLVQESKKIEPSILSFEAWIGMQYLSIRFGLYLYSMICREKAISCAINCKRDSLIDLQNIFKALVDKGDLNDALEIVNFMELSEPASVDGKSYSMRYYLNLCTGNRAFNKYFLQKELHGNDFQFFRTIRNQSVAIVGPAVSQELNGKEIDSFDLVIRSGYKGKMSIPNSERQGSRTDISYYGSVITKLYIKNNNPRFLKELEWAVFKNEKYIKSLQNIKINLRIFKKNKLFLCGSPCMIENIVFDILHFNPQKVKIFNTNFYCSNKTHHDGYRASATEIKSYIDRYGPQYYRLWDGQPNMASHDLLSQVNFVRNLWANGAVEVDKDCQKILQMSNSQYLNEMEKLYVRPYLKEVPASC